MYYKFECNLENTACQIVLKSATDVQAAVVGFRIAEL